MFGLFKRKSDQNIDLNEFDRLRKQMDAVVLDVRRPVEVAAGAVPGQINIDVSGADFKEKVGVLDKGKTYLVYCRSGMRSARACKVMAKMGFESLYNFKGGIIAWNNRK